MIKRFGVLLCAGLFSQVQAVPFQVTRTLPQPATVRALCFTTPEVLLTGTDARTATLWNVKTAVASRSFQGFSGAISAVACTPTLVAIGSFDGTVMLGGENQTPITWKEPAEVTHLQLSKNALFLYISTSNGNIIKYNTRLKKVVLRWNTNKNLNVLTLNQDDTLMAAGSMEGEVWVYPTDQTVALSHVQFEGPVFGLSFSPGQSMLAVGLEGKGLKRYNWKANTTTTLDAEPGDVLAVQYSPGGQLLAYSRDNTVLIQDSKGSTQSLPLKTQRVRSLAFGQDGKTLAVGTSDNVTFLEGPSGAFERLDPQKGNLPGTASTTSGTFAVPELSENPQAVAGAQRGLLNLDGEPALPLRVLQSLTNLDVLGDGKQVVLANSTSRVNLQVDQATQFKAVTRKGQDLYIPLSALTRLGYTITVEGEQVTLAYGEAFITLKKSQEQLASLPAVLKKSAPWQKAVQNGVLLDGKPALRVEDLIQLVPSLTFDKDTQKLNWKGKYFAKPYGAAPGVSSGLVLVQQRTYFPLEGLKAVGITPSQQGGKWMIQTGSDPFPLQVQVPSNLSKVNYQRSRQAYEAEQKRLEQARLAEQKRIQQQNAAALKQQQAEQARIAAEQARIAAQQSKIQKKIDVLHKEFPKIQRWVSIDGSYFGTAYIGTDDRVSYEIYYVNDKFKRVLGKGCYNFGKQPLPGSRVLSLDSTFGGMLVLLEYQGAMALAKVSMQDAYLCKVEL